MKSLYFSGGELQSSAARGQRDGRKKEDAHVSVTTRSSTFLKFPRVESKQLEGPTSKDVKCPEILHPVIHATAESQGRWTLEPGVLVLQLLLQVLHTVEDEGRVSEDTFLVVGASLEVIRSDQIISHSDRHGC